MSSLANGAVGFIQENALSEIFGLQLYIVSITKLKRG